MRFRDRFYLAFSRLLPALYRNAFAQELTFAGLSRADAELTLGKATLLSLLLCALPPLLVRALQHPLLWWHYALGAGVLIMVHLVTYLLIYYLSADRARRAEEQLPDLLHLIASNLRAGLTPFNALRASQREEFGPLGEELRHATQRATGTDSFGDILLKVGTRINSGTLERTLRLFNTSLRAGGHSATLLEQLATDIVETRQLQKEFVTATKTYSLFIFFTVVMGAPFLLTMSMQFVTMITSISAKTRLGSSSSLGASFFSGAMFITPDFLYWLSTIMLIITGTLASILMGVIREGRIKDGMRMAPLLVIASLFVFYVARRLIVFFF